MIALSGKTLIRTQDYSFIRLDEIKPNTVVRTLAGISKVRKLVKINIPMEFITYGNENLNITDRTLVCDTHVRNRFNFTTHSDIGYMIILELNSPFEVKTTSGQIHVLPWGCTFTKGAFDDKPTGYFYSSTVLDDIHKLGLEFNVTLTKDFFVYDEGTIIHIQKPKDTWLRDFIFSFAFAVMYWLIVLLFLNWDEELFVKYKDESLNYIDRIFGELILFILRVIRFPYVDVVQNYVTEHVNNIQNYATEYIDSVITKLDFDGVI